MYRVARGALDRDAGLDLIDAYDLSRADSVTLNLMTPHEVTVTGPGELAIKGVPEGAETEVSFRLQYNGAALEPEIERLPVEDRRLSRAWGNAVTRIRLKAVDPGRKGSIKVSLSR